MSFFFTVVYWFQSYCSEARWKRCVAATDGALGEALGQVYVEKNFPTANKTFMVQMVHDIEAAMSGEIDAQAWMSDPTKHTAEAKLKLVADKIGYPDHWRDYSTLKIVRGDVLGNAVRAADFENKRELAKIGKPVDRAEWGMSPPTVNAYYNPSMNDINFPAGILQSPFYDPNATDAENYGHIGAIVGHELTHGFDDQGSQFDGYGNLSGCVSFVSLCCAVSSVMSRGATLNSSMEVPRGTSVRMVASSRLSSASL